MIGVSFAVGIAAVLIVFGAPGLLQWLWNLTCPEVFHLPTVRYWQAFRLLLIAGLLFGVWHFV